MSEKYCVTIYGATHRHSEDHIYCDDLKDIPAKIMAYVGYMDHIEFEGFNHEGYDYDELEYTFGGLSVSEVKDIKVDEKRIINELGALLVEQAKKDGAQMAEQKKRRELEQLERLKNKYE
jgi:hypothetical protein